MAVEAKRGCGFRKVGGLYLCGEGSGISCCRLPLALHTCPVCSGGIKQTRGWTWINPLKLFGNDVPRCALSATATYCPAYNLASFGERVGLLWIGEGFYKTPETFSIEADSMGISRRITAMPRGFKLGESWVFLAHPKVVPMKRSVEYDAAAGCYFVCDPDGEPIPGTSIADDEGGRAKAQEHAEAMDRAEPILGPAVFRVFKPRSIEKLIDTSEHDALETERAAYELAVAAGTPDIVPSERLAKYLKERAAGIEFVPVPDDDPDHHGDVHEDRAAEKRAAKELKKTV